MPFSIHRVYILMNASRICMVHPEFTGQVRRHRRFKLNFISLLKNNPISFMASKLHFVHWPVLQDNKKNKFHLFSPNVFLFSLFIIELLIHL